MPRLQTQWLGRVPYGDALSLQNEAVEARQAGRSDDRLLLLEHPPVVTLGSAARSENLLLSEEALAARGVEVWDARRGGDVTYHAPGQLVGYLVVDLAARGSRDVHRFLRDLEDALMTALSRLGLRTRRIPGMTGVFVDDGSNRGPARKIASIGIGLRHWITWHGFALNVGIDLEGFGVIVPCGLRDVEMTSVARELGLPDEEVPTLEARTRLEVTRAFEQSFERETARPAGGARAAARNVPI